MRAYSEEHPRCEVAGAECIYLNHNKYGASRADVHHLKRRSQGGGDEPENLLALCSLHHTGLAGHGFHTTPRDEWFDRFKGRLPSETRGKVERALRIEPEMATEEAS